MKNFLKENWFKLMTGTSMLVFSFAFLMYAVSPTYANYTKEVEKTKVEKPLPSPSDKVIVTSNGYAYTWDGGSQAYYWINYGDDYPPAKRKLP